MAKKKQHKVGEQFTKCGIIYEVRESEEFACNGCALMSNEGNCLDSPNDGFEPCVSTLRDDEKDVIFVKVGEAPEGAPLNSEEELDAEIDREVKKLHTAPCYEELAAFARHFADWQKQQIMKQAVPAKITLLDGVSYIGEEILSQFKAGDKVKVIVIKD